MLYRYLEQIFGTLAAFAVPGMVFALYFLVAGEQDKMWNAAEASRKIKQRVGDRAETHIYPDAGHAPGAPETVGTLRLGGSEEANRAMDEDYMKKLDAWLP